MARKADLIKIGKEAFDNLDKMLQQPLPADDENLQQNKVKFPMARKADLVKIGKEAFDILDKMLQQPLPADQEAKHELPNALMRRRLKPQKNRDIGAQSTDAVVITKQRIRAFLFSGSKV